MTNFERIKNMSADELAAFLEKNKHINCNQIKRHIHNKRKKLYNRMA